MDCSPPGSSVHGILQARILEWVAISFSRGSSQPRDRTQISCIAGRLYTVWATSSESGVFSSWPGPTSHSLQTERIHLYPNAKASHSLRMLAWRPWQLCGFLPKTFGSTEFSLISYSGNREWPYGDICCAWYFMTIISLCLREPRFFHDKEWLGSFF